MSNQKKVVSYDVLRVITTVLVVLSHCRYYEMATPYGGCSYAALVDPGKFSWIVVSQITSFVNTITMPTFMALGGALFFKSMEHGRFPTLGALAVNKAKRLLIPFLAVGCLYSFPLKLATGYFSASENPLLDFFLGQLLLQGNTHLWFLPAMFFVFLICYVLEFYVKIPKVVKLTVFAVVSMAFWNFEISILAYTLRNLFWFYGGYCFESQRKDTTSNPGFSAGLLGMALAILTYFCASQFHGLSGMGKVLYLLGMRLIVPAAGIGALYALSCALTQTHIPSSRIFQCLSRNSFGIYLYSDPVNYVILYVGASFFSTFLFGNSLGIFVLYLLRFIITLTCAVLVCGLLRKYKIKYIV